MHGSAKQVELWSLPVAEGATTHSTFTPKQGKEMPNGCRKHSPGHRFDPLSGWCEYGCGARDDGRLVKADRGVIVPGPEYTPEQLTELLQRAQTTR